MKSFLVFSSLVLIVQISTFAAPQDDLKGVIEVVHEPKNCFVDPCPQYRVISINGVKVSNLGADISNFDPQKSAAAAFKKFSVEGVWTLQDNYLDVTANSWHAVVGEKIAPPAALPLPAPTSPASTNSAPVTKSSK